MALEVILILICLLIMFIFGLGLLPEFGFFDCLAAVGDCAQVQLVDRDVDLGVVVNQPLVVGGCGHTLLDVHSLLIHRRCNLRKNQ